MSQRSLSIDALRGAAVLLVLQLHVFNNVGHYYAGTSSALAKLLGAGASGVDIFFVLSAYLLTTNLLSRRHDARAVPAFYIRRIYRILPMFLVVVFAGFALHAVLLGSATGITWLWFNPYPIWVYLLFLQNWWTGVTGPVAAFYGPLWSLDVEEHFYLLLPLMVTRLTARQLAWLAAISVVAAPLIRIELESLIGGYSAYYWTIARIDSFGWGMLIALAPTLAPNLVHRIEPHFALCGGIIVYIAAALLGHLGTPMFTTAMAIAAALLTFAVAGFNRRAMGRSGVALRVLAWFGERCYSLYLLQVPVIGLVFLAAGYSMPVIDGENGLVLLAMAVLLTLLLSDMTYRRIELPFVALGHRLSAAPALDSSQPTR